MLEVVMPVAMILEVVTIVVLRIRVRRVDMVLMIDYSISIIPSAICVMITIRINV